MYSKSGLLCQSLEMTYVLRMLFDIPAGEGFIMNFDESMCYRYDESRRTWTIKKNLIILFRRLEINNMCRMKIWKT